eukprot:TRINITY_DN19518_c0_g1_i1.p1 TRINITY_DN19518_c0_g1~~TRINITY_DN19518_c0_g1_i1.p1  ORF type:complete len:190 (+),score=34.09 TRINITY_DN19518_c0_g1_i1:68-637(+)
MTSIRVVTAGDHGVGKTSLLVRLSGGNIDAPNTAEAFEHKVTINGKEVRLVMQDTAGQEHFAQINSVYYRGAAAVLLVFSLSDSQSFRNLSAWVADVKKFADAQAQFILIANKSDMTPHQVPAEEIKALTDRESFFYFETSAKTGSNVDKLLSHLLALGGGKQEQTITINPPNPNPNSNSNTNSNPPGC